MGFLLCISSAIGSEPLDDLASALQQVSAITKINNNLYVGHEDDLYFGFERVTKDTIDFWKNYVKKQYALQSETIKNLKGTQYSKVGKTLGDARTGIGSFENSLGYYDRAEVWIAYVTTKKIDTMAKNISAKGFIEMAVPVLTEADIPFYTPMGIFRAIEFYEASPFYDKKIPVHKDLAMRLHSFVAQAIKRVYGNKDFFITKPIIKMAEIMQAKLPKESYWNSYAPGDEQIVSIYDKNYTNDMMQILREGAHNKEIPFKTPFFYYDHMDLALNFCPTIMVDIDALAKLMKLD